MVIVGLYNTNGFRIRSASDFNTRITRVLEVVYKDDKGTYYRKYLDSGDLCNLVFKIDKLEDRKIRDHEIECFINEKRGNLVNRCYTRGKNKFVHRMISLEDPSIINMYTPLETFEQGVVKMENNSSIALSEYHRALVVSDSDIFIGRREFVYENAKEYFSFQNKSIDELYRIILELISLNYYDEALRIIEYVKSSNMDVSDYSIGDHGDLFDLYEKNILAFKEVKEKTKSLGLHYFRI